MSTGTEAFFITARDIQRFFGIAPPFYEIYRKEASQNYPQGDQEEEQPSHKQYKKYENNINEKLPPEGYYYKIRPTQKAFEYDKQYSNKEENATPYIKSVENKNYDHYRNHHNERIKDSRNKQNPTIYFQFPALLSKHSGKSNKEVDAVDNEDRKKDIVSGILVALPNFNGKEVLNEPNYFKNKYFVKAFLSNTPQPEYSEGHDQLNNIFL